MQIFTLTSIAGAEISCPPGVVVDWPDKAEAQRMIDGGNARKPTDGELAVAGERKESAAAKAAAEAEADAKVAEVVAKANKKRAADAKKADEKKRKAAGRPVGRPPNKKPAKAKKTTPAK